MHCVDPASCTGRGFRTGRGSGNARSTETDAAVQALDVSIRYFESDQNNTHGAPGNCSGEIDSNGRQVDEGAVPDPGDAVRRQGRHRRRGSAAGSGFRHRRRGRRARDRLRHRSQQVVRGRARADGPNRGRAGRGEGSGRGQHRGGIDPGGGSIQPPRGGARGRRGNGSAPRGRRGGAIRQWSTSSQSGKR